MKKKILTALLLGFVLVGSLTVWMSKPQPVENQIIMEFDDPDPTSKLGK